MATNEVGAVLFTRVPIISGVPGAEKLARLPTADTLSNLQVLVGRGANVIVVDSSVADEPGLREFLYGQLKQGKSVMGINISLHDLYAASDFVRAVEDSRVSPGKGSRVARSPAPLLDIPSYSFVHISKPGPGARQFGAAQRYFEAGMFADDLAVHAAGYYKEPPAAPLRRLAGP
jgi:hypothetical protein